MKKVKKKSVLGSFDSLYRDVICKLFKNISDSRASNYSYSLEDSLKSGFAIYSLKCPSLLSFRKRSKFEDSNLATVYDISEIPSDNGFRKILDALNPVEIRKGFHNLFKRIRRLGILDTYKYWREHLVLSIDGVEHFCSKTIDCPHCLHRKHRDGTTSNYHSMLSVAIVHPEHKEVFPLDHEPIVQQDGETKNDCERNAAKRLIKSLEKNYSKNCMVLTFDALYACGPIIKLLMKNNRWKFIINATPDGNKTLFQQFESRKKRGQLKTHIIENKDGIHEFSYSNSLALNNSHPDIRVNMLYYKWTNPKGEVKIFTWITNIKLSKANVFKVMKMGRSRWKIENETFNTLKNQGYHFEHNFGHGKQYLCTVFAYLMMLAFCVDQIQQNSCQYFKKLLQELGTRVKLWESLRAVFKLIACQNMKGLFFSIADMYCIRLE